MMISRRAFLTVILLNASCYGAKNVSPFLLVQRGSRSPVKSPDSIRDSKRQTARFFPGYPQESTATLQDDVGSINGSNQANGLSRIMGRINGSSQQSQDNNEVIDGPSIVPTNAMATSATFSLLETPASAFQLFADKGGSNAKASSLKTLVSAMLGGSYVGMGGMLSLAIAGNMGGVAATNPGLTKLVFAFLFPVNLLLCVQCGGQLFTGNTANMAAAVCEKKATMKDLARSWGLSYAGNFIGCVGFACLSRYCGVLSGGAANMAAATLVSKTSTAFGPLIVKSMLCNWLVCLALFLSFQAKDMMGKYISILLPISTFVAIGFEHSVANMFLLPAGLLCSTGVSIKTALFQNLLPVTLGNALSGSMMVGVMFSFMFGRLGEGK